MKKKILFLYSGGTIGQIAEKVGDKVISVPPKDATEFKTVCDKILQKFTDTSDVTFEVVTTKESANMTPNDWEKLIFRVKKAQDEEGYDAVGITHGTDTLAYIANALAFALHGAKPQVSGLRIPVCITGSQNPVYQVGGDGRFNLENLFRTLVEAIDKGVADVMVNFWNRVILGCRVLKVSERDFDAMRSPAFSDVGLINSRGVILKTELLHNRSGALDKIQLAPKFGRGVVSFELTPGLDPNMVLDFITGGGVQAMILKSLGEGNVCSEGAYSLTPVIRQATEEYMVPILLVTKFVGGYVDSAIDASGYAALQAGAISCLDQTDVTVDVKTRWILGNGLGGTIEDFRSAMHTNYIGEVTSFREQ